MIVRALIAAGVVCVVSPALAQPAPTPPPTTGGNEDLSKKSATELRDLGNKLFAEGEYLGALAAYKEAYRRLPSSKILFNIGVTLNKLDGRAADAANVFQRYIEEKDADPKTKLEIEKNLAEIDKKLGVLELTITPPGTQIQVNDGEWVPAVKLYRVPPGPVTINVKKDGFTPETKPAQVAAGERSAIPIELKAIKGESEIVYVEKKPDGPRGRVGAMAMEHLDIPHKGAATRVAVTVDLIDRIALQGGALLGPNYGGYVGGAFSVLTGSFRPIIAIGMPVFFSDGARYGMRGAGGIELQLTRHIALTAELGVEYMVNPEDDIKETVFIPAVGATGRL